MCVGLRMPFLIHRHSVAREMLPKALRASEAVTVVLSAISCISDWVRVRSKSESHARKQNVLTRCASIPYFPKTLLIGSSVRFLAGDLFFCELC